MRIKKGGYVYLRTNDYNTTIYTGVTSDLAKRNWEHKVKKYPKAFTAKYNLSKLVYYEECPSIGDAITREKQIKAGSRKKKEELIRAMNPEWKDLSDEVQ